MLNRIFLLIMLAMTSCFSKNTEEKASLKLDPSKVIVQSLEEKSGNDLNSVHQNILKFAGSVEVEVFKIIANQTKKEQKKQNKIESKIPSQLNILSQLFQVPQARDLFYDCKKVQFKNITEGRIKGIISEIHYLRLCEKNPQIIATLQQTSKNIFKLKFIQAQWRYVIGDSALMNLPDKTCDIIVNNQIVTRISCDHTLITLASLDQLEEIKIHNYVFDRYSEDQIKVVGGRYKNMLEFSQIKMSVPDQGRIKIIEKEMVIKDEFSQEEAIAVPDQNTVQQAFQTSGRTPDLPPGSPVVPSSLPQRLQKVNTDSPDKNQNKNNKNNIGDNYDKENAETEGQESK